MRPLLALAVTLVQILWLPYASASAPQRGPATDDGWFFYDDPLPPVAKPVPKPKPVLPGGGQGSSETPLSAAWFRENLQKYQDLAIDQPTVENVRLFMLLQKTAMDKAERFSQVQQVAVSLDPTIDESARNPITALGKAAQHEERSAERTHAFRDLSQRVGIWYFFRSDCHFCLAQSPLLVKFAERYGITILPISIDGAPMVDGSFPQYMVSDGHAEKLGVSVTPTLFLANGADVVPLATGLRTLPELERRFLSVAHSAGWLSDAAFDAASGASGLPLVDLAQPPPSNDPNELLAYLRELHGGGATPLTPMQNLPPQLQLQGAAP